MKFNELKLNNALLNAINRQGYLKQSEIQKKAIPLILEGKDLMGQARTGTGKTAAFAIPLIEKISPSQNQQVLVLVPTRELAVQVNKEFQKLSSNQRIFSIAVFGGQSINMQQKALKRGCQVIAATPGRLMDLGRRGAINFSEFKFVVLDEADKMLEMGFLEDIEFILSKCNNRTQTLLFSATMPEAIQFLAKKFLKKDAVFVNVSADQMSVEGINQYYILVDPKKRVSVLAKMILSRKMKKCLVFCRTRRTSEWLAKRLAHQGVKARSVHGGFSQKARLNLVNDFRSGRIAVLTATDLLARGLDINNISHIINFDFPQQKETYLHRIGRTARFGKTGEAITFCTNLMQLQDLKAITAKANAKIKELK